MELGVSAIVLQGAELPIGGWLLRGGLPGFLPGWILQRLAEQIIEDVDEEELMAFFQARAWVQQRFVEQKCEAWVSPLIDVKLAQLSRASSPWTFLQRLAKQIMEDVIVGKAEFTVLRGAERRSVGLVAPFSDVLQLLRQSTEVFGRIYCVFYVIVVPDFDFDSPFALENLDITSTRPLYLGVIAPDSSVHGGSWKNFTHFLLAQRALLMAVVVGFSAHFAPFFGPRPLGR